MTPPDRRKPWEWCESHVVVDDTSALPGRWRSDNSPWVREVMEEAVKRRRCVVRCSAQSSKTQTVLNLCCWAISQDPGPAMWVMAAKDEAKDFLRDRVMPTFDNCKPVKVQLMSQDGLTLRFASMPFYFTGAGSKSKLQSKPIKWLFLDEVRNYPKGALELALKRTTSYWNAHELIISTPSMKDDDVDLEFKAGDQRHWHVICPKCSTEQVLKFDKLKWDSNEITKPEGKWNWDALAGTIRYPCEKCEHVWRDTPAERRQIIRNGRFVALNPNAPIYRVSFTWSSMLPTWIPWRRIVEEFLRARHAAKADPPDLEPLKAFVNETLGEPWEDALGVIDDYEFLDQRKQDYGFNDPWPEEQVRFMAADKQEAGGEHYWWLIRAFGKGGKSRLIAYGRCNTLDELEQLRVQYNVKLNNAMIDSGFKASSVYRFCSARGWKAFKGDNSCESYTHTVPDRNGRPATVKRIWYRTMVDPAFGTKLSGRMKHIPLFRFANDTAKDMLAELMRGMAGEFTIPKDAGSQYLKQVTAERRIEVTDPKGRTRYEWRQMRKDNHLGDCEIMCHVAAVITNLLHSGTVRVPSKGV